MTFTIQGFTYYQQYRKCGKDGCKCNHGEPHGPYWYKRSLNANRIHYVGKDLPEHVEAAYEALMENRSKLHSTRRRLLDEANTIKKLLAGQRLTNAEKAIIDHLGFAECLVSWKRTSRIQQTRAPYLVSA